MRCAPWFYVHKFSSFFSRGWISVSFCWMIWEDFTGWRGVPILIVRGQNEHLPFRLYVMISKIFHNKFQTTFQLFFFSLKKEFQLKYTISWLAAYFHYNQNPIVRKFIFHKEKSPLLVRLGLFFSFLSKQTIIANRRYLHCIGLYWISLTLCSQNF